LGRDHLPAGRLHFAARVVLLGDLSITLIFGNTNSVYQLGLLHSNKVQAIVIANISAEFI